MVNKRREDTVVRISKLLDLAIERYLSDRKVRLKFSSKKNFVDQAVLNFLEDKGVKLDK